MVCDNEKQRQLLIQIIQNVQVGGNLEQASQTLVIIKRLLQDVQDAEISK